MGLIDEIVHAIDSARLIFEAPRKEQQVWFLRRFGAEVNLGNIAPDDVLSLETLRLGLRSDTMGPDVVIVALARHGETAYNAQRRFQGHLPVPLNERGREQAHELARSPPSASGRRCGAPAGPGARDGRRSSGRRSATHPIDDARFAETDCGDWTDRFFDDVHAAEDPSASPACQPADPTSRFPAASRSPRSSCACSRASTRCAPAPLPRWSMCHRGIDPPGARRAARRRAAALAPRCPTRRSWSSP